MCVSFHRWISRWLDIVQWIIQSCPHHKVCNQIPLCPHFCSNWLLIGLNLSKWMRLPCSPIKRPHTSCQTKIWFCPDLDIQRSISLTGTFDNTHFLWFRDMFACTKCFWKCTKRPCFWTFQNPIPPLPLFSAFAKGPLRINIKICSTRNPHSIEFCSARCVISKHKSKSVKFRRAQKLEGMRL